MITSAITSAANTLVYVNSQREKGRWARRNEVMDAAFNGAVGGAVAGGLGYAMAAAVSAAKIAGVFAWTLNAIPNMTGATTMSVLNWRSGIQARPQSTWDWGVFGVGLVITGGVGSGTGALSNGHTFGGFNVAEGFGTAFGAGVDGFAGAGFSAGVPLGQEYGRALGFGTQETIPQDHTEEEEAFEPEPVEVFQAPQRKQPYVYECEVCIRRR